MAAGKNEKLTSHVVIHQSSIFELVVAYLKVRPYDIKLMAEDTDNFLMDVKGLYSDETHPCPRVCMTKIVKSHLWQLGEARSFFISQSLRLMDDAAHSSTGLLLMSLLMQAKTSAAERRVVLGFQRVIDRLAHSSFKHVDCAYLLIALCFNCEYFHKELPFNNLSMLVVSIFDSARDNDANFGVLRKLVQMYLDNISSQKRYKMLDLMMEFLPHMSHMYCTEEGIHTVLSMLNDFQRNKNHEEYPTCIVHIKRQLLRAVRCMFMDGWQSPNQFKQISLASNMVAEVLHYPLGFK